MLACSTLACAALASPKLARSVLFTVSLKGALSETC
jgi:hypothetical protein